MAPDPGWGANLGLGGALLAALAYIGRWLVSQVDRLQKENRSVMTKVIDDVVPALQASTANLRHSVEVQESLAQQRAVMVARMEELIADRKQLDTEREELHRRELEVVRAEGRLGRSS